jgi:hypothetical protein
VLNNPLKYTDPSGWAYMGYNYFEYKQGFNFETARNGSAGDLFWDPNPGKGYMVDGMPASKAEYLTAVRSGGEINIPGLIAALYQVINADGSISVVDTPGEAVDLYNQTHDKNKIAFENGVFVKFDVMPDEPPVEAPSLESLSAGGNGAPSVISKTDPQDKIIKKDSTAYDMKDMIKGLEDPSIPTPNKIDYLRKLQLPFLNPEKGPWTDDTLYLNIPPNILLP